MLKIHYQCWQCNLSHISNYNGNIEAIGKSKCSSAHRKLLCWFDVSVGFDCEIREEFNQTMEILFGKLRISLLVLNNQGLDNQGCALQLSKEIRFYGFTGILLNNFPFWLTW